MTLTIDKLLEMCRGVEAIARPMPVRIIQMPDHMAPTEHYATSLYIAIAHPFWFWLYRKLGWSTSTLYEVIRGYSRQLRRQTKDSWILPDGTIVCTRRAYAELKRQTDHFPTKPNPLSGYNSGLYSGLFR